MQSSFVQRKLLPSLGADRRTLDQSKLDSELSQDVIDVRVLRALCLSSGLPATWRELGWKVLLGVLPPCRELWRRANEINKNMYRGLLSAARCVCDCYKELAEKERNILTAYTLYKLMPKRTKLATRERYPDIDAMKSGLADSEMETVRPILKTLLIVFESEDAAFWSLIHLIKKHKRYAVALSGARIQSYGVKHRLRYLTEVLVSREPALLKSLRDLGIQEHQYAQKWFLHAFSGTLEGNPNSCVELWDALLSSPVDFIVYVAFSVIVSLKEVILKIIDEADGDTSHASKQVLEILKDPPGFSSNVRCVVDKACSVAPEFMQHERLESDSNNIVCHIEWPTVKFGDRDSVLVRIMQYLLKAHGYRLWFTLDGFYGRRTEGALRKFRISIETGNGLSNRETAKSWAGESFDELPGSLTHPSSTSSSSQAKADPPYTVGQQLWPKLILEIRSGIKGDGVKALQVALVDLHGYDDVRVDGFYGTKTYEAVIDFQKNKALHMIPVDGRVGPVTWIHLLGSRE